MKSEFTVMRPGDVFLVYVNETAAFFGRAEEIAFDVKKGWRNFRFTVLDPQLKERELTWILEPSQIDGEPYTMGGTPIRIERLPPPATKEPEPPGTPEPILREEPQKSATVIEFPKRKDVS